MAAKRLTGGSGCLSRDGFDRLAALVANCATAGVARQALLLRVDRLPISLTRPHHIRLAEAALAPMLRLPRAELFRLPGPSLAVVWRGDAEAALLDVIDALEHLLTDPAADMPPLTDLIALYDLPNTGDLLLGSFSRQVRHALEAPVAGAAVPGLDPPFLALLEGCLAQADVSRFARREAVWRLDASRPALAWEDRALSIGELTAELAPGYDLRSEPWLFRRLTRTLDRRMLALLASPGELASSGPFSVSLNIGSLLGPDFLRFDAALPPGLRGRVVLVLSPADVVADARSFPFAVGFARARGYRVLLRAEGADVLHALSPALREFDHMAVPWSDTLHKEADWLLAESQPDRIVLTGCDTVDAIDWGSAHGVRLFSGLAANAAIVA